MTTLDDSPRTDLSLVADVRDGWRDAFGELYRRHHGAALRYALMLTGGDEAQAQDLVAEAFARVLRATSDGGGSTVAFRPYLLSAVRHEYLAELRRSGRVDLVESADELDDVSPNGADDRFDDPTVTSAFRRLPERWRTVLWHTEVKGDKPADIASLMGISANAAAALASRAREGLRQEYLQEHVAGARRECGPYATRLARLVRSALSPREQQLVEAHLRLCADCSRARSELRGLNGRMRSIFPAIIGAGALWPGQGLQSLSGLPAAASGGSSWVGSACVAGTGAVVAPATVATTTAGIGVAGVVTAGFAKVAATAAAVVAGSAAAFGFAAHPAPVGNEAGDPLVVVTPTDESATPDADVPRPVTATDESSGGVLADDAAPADTLEMSSSTMEATSSLMAPEQAATGEGTSPVGEAGGPPSAPVSTGESPPASTPAGEQSGTPSSGGSSDSPSSSGSPSSHPSSGGDEASPGSGSGSGSRSGSGSGSSRAPESSAPESPGSSSAPDGARGRDSAGPPPWASASPNSAGPEAEATAPSAEAARALIGEWRRMHDSSPGQKWPGLRWLGGR